MWNRVDRGGFYPPQRAKPSYVHAVHAAGTRQAAARRQCAHPAASGSASAMPTARRGCALDSIRRGEAGSEWPIHRSPVITD